jgi:hypothetical protein
MNRYSNITQIYETYGYYDYLDPSILADMRNDICEFILSKNYSLDQVKRYLMVNITSNKEKDKYVIIGYNIICALWMSGIYPKNVDEIAHNNFYETNDKIYRYNNKTNKLKVTIK